MCKTLDLDHQDRRKERSTIEEEDMDVNGKTVFVTGGAQGVGRSLVEAVLQKGAKVCIADFNATQGKSTLTELQEKWGKENVIFEACDVSDSKSFESSFQKAVSHFGRIDVLVNNAGIVSEKDWEKCINVNFMGVVRGTMLALEHMRTDRGGHGGVIINTSSTAGLAPGFWVPVYAGTKSAVVNFTCSWAANPDITNAGVRLATVCPSGTSTAMINEAREDQMYHKESFVQVLKKHGLCDMEHVTGAFMKAIEEDSSNGVIFMVTASGGIQAVKTSFNVIIVDSQ
ncbi:15-hydroxyprostaglandin dehydrogenase [NAD(+)]-like isoform X3 [Haliotis rufescens]|uniref:15-hydroxyprostaglandin dehydrogenase [NAD(+)]-like isoform X3 n=1 Tax=Haliotis rufescens TaxID=6454 RepID=UPI00201F5905|nr:15-hydroxyprostaglandin dehydrogenase [NAD(+)]-like isoform X3 [Haliotis rufescens]